MGSNGKVAALVIGLAGVASCAQIIGLEPYGGAGGGGAASSATEGTGGATSRGGGGASTSGSDRGSSSTGSSCAGGMCLTAPSGWSGPGALVVDPMEATCPQGAKPLLTAVEEPASLTCTGAGCSCTAEAAFCTVDFELFSDPNCMDSTLTLVSTGGCTPIGAQHGYLLATNLGSSGGACSETASDSCIAPAANRVALCPGSSGCESPSSCFPGPSPTPICVWKMGAGVNCPAGFPVLQEPAIFEHVDLDGCVCAQPSGDPCTPAKLSYASDGACGTAIDLTYETCTKIAGQASSVFYGTTPVSCAPPAITASPSGPIVVCCSE